MSSDPPLPEVSTTTRIVGAATFTALVVLPARESLDGAWWVLPFVAAIALALTYAIPIEQRLLPPGWVPGLLVGVAAINYACVPETDPIRQLVIFPVLLVAIELWTDRPLPWGLIYAIAGMVMLAGVYGATGRESALVGALFSWWPVIALPCFARWLPDVRPPRFVSLALVILPLAAAPAVVSRSGALEPTAEQSLREVAIAAPLSMGVAAIVTLALQRRPGRIAQRAG
jgi:hypothetical protein